MLMRRKPFPIGEKFGRLTVADVGKHNSKRGSYHMICQCDCGKTIEVREDCLTTGNTASCGCLHKESIHKTHGMHKSRTYRIWAGMKQRCSRNYKGKKSHLYAGKGIKFCDRWMSFENFLADMGEAPKGLTIDRINSDGNYEPQNCRWATSKTQGNNTSANKIITYKGETKTLSLWADELSIKANTLNYRLIRGWSVERAFNTPVEKRSYP